MGPSIVGYGTYPYRTKAATRVMRPGGLRRPRARAGPLLDVEDATGRTPGRLGKHKMGKSCLYIKRLADLDIEALDGLIAGSVAVDATSLSDKGGSVQQPGNICDLPARAGRHAVSPVRSHGIVLADLGAGVSALDEGRCCRLHFFVGMGFVVATPKARKW